MQNGIDLKEFQNTPLSINGQVRILGVGSLIQYKRWDRLVRAALTLKTKGLDFHIDVVGDGPLRHSLEQLAATLNVADRITFKGHSGSIPTLLKQSTFLAHTSDIEGCPNAVMEAMACGRAVVATDVGDIPFLVEEGRTGFVVLRGDEAAFTDRLAKLIKDRVLCGRLGRAGRLKAEKEFGAEHLAADTLATYTAFGWTEQDLYSNEEERRRSSQDIVSLPRI